MSDPVAFGIFGAALLAALGAGEALRVWAGWAPESTRRLVHAFVGVATAGSVPLFESPAWLYGLAALFGVVNFVAAPRGVFPGLHGIARHSWGTVTFPLALVVALYVAWTLDDGRVVAIQAAFLALGFADPAASFVGTRLREPFRYQIGGETKSIRGSQAFFAVATLAIWGVLVAALPTASRTLPAAGGLLGLAVMAASLATVAEALGRRGWDNLWIVLAVLVGLVGWTEGRYTAESSAVGMGLAVAFGAVAYRLRSLDLSGAVAAGLLTWLVVAVGGWAWAVPIFVFFALSSVLSRLGRRRKAGAEALAEKGSRRDAGQVAANGGVAGAMLAATIFWPQAEPALYAAFLGSLAAAAADTWATELGTLAGGATRRLAVGRRVPPGTSGGMSGAGTLGAVAGAASVVGAAWPFTGLSLSLAAGLAAAGVAGSLADTALGATVQARYRLPSGDLTERRTEAGVALPLAAGVEGVGNDAVNVACTAVGAALAAAVWALTT